MSHYFRGVIQAIRTWKITKDPRNIKLENITSFIFGSIILIYRNEIKEDYIQEKLKNMTKIDLEYLIKFAEEHNLSHESVEKVIEKLKEYYNLS